MGVNLFQYKTIFHQKFLPHHHFHLHQVRRFGGLTNFIERWKWIRQSSTKSLSELPQYIQFPTPLLADTGGGMQASPIPFTFEGASPLLCISSPQGRKKLEIAEPRFLLCFGKAGRRLGSLTPTTLNAGRHSSFQPIPKP